MTEARPSSAEAATAKEGTSPVAAPPAQPAASVGTIHRRAWLLTAVIGMGLAGYFGSGWWAYRRSHSITEDAFVEAHIVNVAPEMVSGRIVRFLVEENDQVEQDQVLAEVEPVHYRDQVEQARGKLDLAEAELKRQEAGLEKL